MSGGMTPEVHKRFLDYRERYGYFGNKAVPQLTADAFVDADAEHRALEAKGEDDRDDEEEQRFAELAKLLFRD
ncbi:MAG TPA: hypothetical protein VGI39_00450 [Polyangiaceae bacterium]|jgi:hypothetical protein